MKTLNMNENLVCLYCDEDQQEPVRDFIPRIPNVQLGGGDLDRSVQEHQCCGCDQHFYLKLDSAQGNTVKLANLPSKLY